MALPRVGEKLDISESGVHSYDRLWESFARRLVSRGMWKSARTCRGRYLKLGRPRTNRHVVCGTNLRIARHRNDALVLFFFFDAASRKMFFSTIFQYFLMWFFENENGFLGIDRYRGKLMERMIICKITNEFIYTSEVIYKTYSYKLFVFIFCGRNV